ncbi:FtsQ-type POTRA domain-containing protein [Microbacterium sp. ASV81]|uniref:FtsQ-type POTRA domain-containing protein n=1 Tax=Microbacterium capsulatum TaxID=3041921 RepID=A0ABU0XCX1_9MICO|nr:FtsQ-type POTRA domain-containing protein [Microbacterium sp. ASV81]MDQ4212963.1 FtsQ-type POTRA domain-containing protein [Microbacterium sp. ASV81]
MRRPSPIPQQAPPVEPAESARPATTVAGRIPVSGESVGGAGRGVQGERTGFAVPIRLDERIPAGTAHERAIDGGGGSDGPLTARDLWQAAKARRKVLRAEIRRFTQRSRRRRIGWLVGVLAALVVVGGSVAAAYSPLFAVQTITVQGTSALRAADVQKALEGEIGTPLALVDSNAVKAALVRFPLIETYQLEAHPPHDLVVRIVERTPVGVVHSEGGFTVVDAAGVALSTTPQRPAGYALIDIKGGTNAAAFAAAGTVLRTLPAELRKQVDGVTAATPDDVALQLTGGAKVVWGSADQSALKTLTLQRLIAAKPDQSLYDVSSPGVGVVG